MACVSLSQGLLGCNQSRTSWWQNTEANPVSPLTREGLWHTSPSSNFLLNQKFFLQQSSSFQDHSRLFSSKQYYTAGLSTPHRDSLWLPAFKQLILPEPSCCSVSISTLNCSKIFLRSHLKAHCYACNFEADSERQTLPGLQVYGTVCACLGLRIQLQVSLVSC